MVFTAALLWCFLATASAGITSYEVLDYDSVADPQSVVTRGSARFTVLTDRLIRMEQVAKPGGAFEDRATLAMVNRKLPVPAFKTQEKDGWLTLTTSAVTLSYKVGDAFSASSLKVSGAFGAWAYGDRNDGNLLGTIKSLDLLGPISLNCTENNATVVHGETLHCEWGVVSRDGWSIYHDESNYCLGASDWWAADASNVDTLDMYGFFHGHDFKGALADFVKVGGKAAMVPRAALGIWWTRWYDFNEFDALAVVEAYRSRSVPLDIFVLDMDWHKKNSWTGYSYDRSLFPDPSSFMAEMHDEGLYMAANLHDDVGVGPWEDDYAYMAKLMGVTNTSATVPFTMCVNQTYTYALEDVVLGGIESGRIGGKLAEGGMDFWWIDWQQGGNHGGCAGLKQNPTIWTNKVRCTDAKRRALARGVPRDAPIGRNMVLARWGGMGTHRYQVGFSGDVHGLTWVNLAYQPYYSLTSANVAYGLWSHDIEGNVTDPELYVRWVQWAAVSPIFRSHERGMSGGVCADNEAPPPHGGHSMCSTIEAWDVSAPYFEANRAAMQWRSAHVPYIYSALREYYDTGLSLLRPMYYEHPEVAAAYGATPSGAFSQYYFGPDLIAAPVVVQSNTSEAPVAWRSGMTTTSVWLPPGTWFELATSVMHTGASQSGSFLTKAYDISETPLFARAGAVIPTVPQVDGASIATARKPYTALSFDVYPGAKSGSARVYEDDGETTAYLGSGGFSWSKASYAITNATRTPAPSTVHPRCARSLCASTAPSPPRRSRSMAPPSALRAVVPRQQVEPRGSGAASRWRL
jgi:alpha-glucosidase (family GH31 glycosyl hydrolase)